jgi:hypothetical protein
MIQGESMVAKCIQEQLEFDIHWRVSFQALLAIWITIGLLSYRCTDLFVKEGHIYVRICEAIAEENEFCHFSMCLSPYVATGEWEATCY